MKYSILYMAIIGNDYKTAIKAIKHNSEWLRFKDKLGTSTMHLIIRYDQTANLLKFIIENNYFSSDLFELRNSSQMNLMEYADFCNNKIAIQRLAEMKSRFDANSPLFGNGLFTTNGNHVKGEKSEEKTPLLVREDDKKYYKYKKD